MGEDENQLDCFAIARNDAKLSLRGAFAKCDVVISSTFNDFAIATVVSLPRNDIKITHPNLPLRREGIFIHVTNLTS